MTWERWMAVRRFLWEEQFGTLLRASDNKKSSDYARSVAMLKRHQVEQE